MPPVIKHFYATLNIGFAIFVAHKLWKWRPFIQKKMRCVGNMYQSLILILKFAPSFSKVYLLARYMWIGNRVRSMKYAWFSRARIYRRASIGSWGCRSRSGVRSSRLATVRWPVLPRVACNLSRCMGEPGLCSATMHFWKLWLTLSTPRPRFRD